MPLASAMMEGLLPPLRCAAIGGATIVMVGEAITATSANVSRSQSRSLALNCCAFR
jgi:hypothetical protein